MTHNVLTVNTALNHIHSVLDWFSTVSGFKKSLEAILQWIASGCHKHC